MATQSITQDQIIANLPAPIQQAIEAGRTLVPQVNGRYESAVQLVIAGGVRRNDDGSYDVVSRSGGARHHLNGASCDCGDAQHNAPEIAGRRACAHQIAAWIVGKAAILAAQPATEPAEVSTPAQPAPTIEHMTRAQLIQAATLVNGVEYEIAEIHIGGHGWVPILRAVEDPKSHNSYMIRGDFRDDELYAAHWGAQWGARCVEEMTQFVAALTEKPAAPAPATLAEELAPALAYYLEANNDRIKVMLTHGEAHPAPVNSFTGPDRLERAREFAATRAEAQVRGLRQATPAGHFAVAQTFLPSAWRQRMGGFQVGKAWVIYAEPVAQPEVCHA